jgi:hypothetical protein
LFFHFSEAGGVLPFMVQKSRIGLAIRRPLSYFPMPPTKHNSRPHADMDVRLSLPMPDDIFFEAEAQRFWVINDAGHYVGICEDGLRRHLIRKGYQANSPRRGLSQVDARIHDAEINCQVRFAGPRRGYAAGLWRICGEAVLVTEGDQR